MLKQLSLNGDFKYLYTMLIKIEHNKPNSPLEGFLDSIAERNLTYYASDLLALTGCKSVQELSQALKKATEVCNCMDVPLQENFKVVYRSKEGEVLQDWRLSPMAYLLLIINSDVHSEIVAKMQYEIISKVLKS
jgi:hypothetical protein